MIYELQFRVIRFSSTLSTIYLSAEIKVYARCSKIIYEFIMWIPTYIKYYKGHKNDENAFTKQKRKGRLYSFLKIMILKILVSKLWNILKEMQINKIRYSDIYIYKENWHLWSLFL